MRTIVLKNFLLNEFNKLNINLSENHIDKLECYYDILIEWNSKINLTSIVEYDEVFLKHFLDSLLVLSKNRNIFDDKKIIDIGTGAGFPGLVLAIVCEKASVVLVDSLAKRVTFLNEVIEKLELKNVVAIHSRAEDLARNDNHRNMYDYSVSRAVAELPLLLEYCIPFVKKDGYFISYKSRKIDEEIRNSENAFKCLGCEISNCETIEFSEGERNILFIHNKDVTDLKYPRRAGIPKKKPL